MPIFVLSTQGSIMDNLTIANSIMKNYISNISYWAEPDVLKAIVHSPEQLLKSKKGHCWEQTELAKFLLKEKGIQSRTFFMDVVINNRGNTITHAFLVFQSDDKFYWFESTFDPYRGIHEYKTLDKLLSDAKNKLSISEKKNGRPGEIFRIREYDSPKLPCSHMEYFNHCLNGREVKLKKFPILRNLFPGKKLITQFDIKKQLAQKLKS